MMEILIPFILIEEAFLVKLPMLRPSLLLILGEMASEGQLVEPSSPSSFELVDEASPCS
jgi:hypothetical protein